MHKGLSIAVVIPAYREAGRVAGVIRELPDWIDHIVVVDDCSNDDTAGAARAVNLPNLKVIRLEQNQGVGGATIAGFNHAAELGAEVVIKMDGDGQMDPKGLPAMIDPIRQGVADFTKGNRFVHTHALGQMPFIRRLGNIGVSFMAKMASGYWSNFDPTNGYLAIHSSVWRLLEHDRLQRRFFFENSLLLELGLCRAVVRDVYMPARYNDKVSHLSERKALMEFPPLLLKGYLRRILIQYYVRDFSAASLFFLVGAFSCLFGTVWGLYYWQHYSRLGLAAPTGTVMISVLALVLGLQLLLQALVMDIQNVPRDPISNRYAPDGDPAR